MDTDDMASQRHPTTTRVIPSQAVTDGAGVNIRRGIGTSSLPDLDPFLMIDHFGSEDPDDYIAGFPDHPHRGFTTLTYMIDGHMLHRDSMNNEGHLRAGDVQWMKAASGIIHSEMPQQEAGLMRGFQLWINLPASEKMSDPAYQEFPASEVPVINRGENRVKVIAGQFDGQQGPVVDDAAGLTFLDVVLSGEGGQITTGPLPAACFIYVYDGTVTLTTSSGHVEVACHEVATWHDASSDREGISLRSSGSDARAVVVAWRPVREPIARHGPFVMNTTEEIKTAIRDYQNGQLVRRRASVTTTRAG